MFKKQNNKAKIILAVIITGVMAIYIYSYITNSGSRLTQTYSNSEYNLSFRYPDGWEVSEYVDEENPPSLTINLTKSDESRNQELISISSIKNSDPKVTIEFMRQEFELGDIEYLEQDINGNPSITKITEFGGDEMSYEYDVHIIGEDQRIVVYYSTHVTHEENPAQIYDAIVKSIKF